jgi:hypothetical protein
MSSIAQQKNRLANDLRMSKELKHLVAEERTMYSKSVMEKKCFVLSQYITMEPRSDIPTAAVGKVSANLCR